MIQYGIDSGAELHNGFPWSFDFHGLPATHEEDDSYIVDGVRFNSDEIIVMGICNVCTYNL